ncbi:MAG: hypothetical protein ACFNZS_13415, partial [Ottowia sp.]
IMWMNLFVSLLAGLVIFPAVFAFGFKPSQGPGLIFVVLPAVFMKMPERLRLTVSGWRRFFPALWLRAIQSRGSRIEGNGRTIPRRLAGRRFGG